MPIPISYNIRNLRLRKGLTIMTALGIALTVTTAIFLMALLAGLKRAFVTSGEPLNVLVLRKGSEAELTGGFESATLQTLKYLRGPFAVAQFPHAIAFSIRDHLAASWTMNSPRSIRAAINMPPGAALS